MAYLDILKDRDIDIARLIKQEMIREEKKIVLIASENYSSPAVLEAMGSVLTNKYGEGYPKKRYYGGCEYIDEVEQIAIDRAKELFGAKYVNVQPHSGSSANMAVYFSVLEPGDRVLGLRLEHGGHLTHGAKVSFSGKFFQSFFYELDNNGFLNYDKIEEIAKKVKPKLIITGYSSYSREIDFKKFREIADNVGAYLMADIAHIAGLVAAGVHQSPVGIADFVTATTHKTLRGPRGGIIISKTEELAKKIDKTIFPGIQGGPLFHVIAAKAVAFKEAMQEQFKLDQIQTVKNSKALCDEFKRLGYKIVSDGTDNHLFVVDLRSKNLDGKKAQEVLDKAGITLNRNAIPNDPLPPTITSGIRIGTPIVTTRGMKEKDMKDIAYFIDKVLSDIDNENTINRVRKEVEDFCSKFPFYKDLIEQCRF